MIEKIIEIIIRLLGPRGSRPTRLTLGPCQVKPDPRTSKGATGATGSRGPKGDTGDKGATGPRGLQRVQVQQVLKHVQQEQTK